MKTMHKQIATLLIGAVLGAVATYYFMPSTPTTRFAEAPERDIQSVPEVSLAEAEDHRADRYASIKTIEDTLALPTDFAETEALYAIAGRADSDEVQNLIHQAARIHDRNDRRAALGILFLRLTELDPYSALAIARTPTFQSDETHERSVWVAWGRLDLDAALRAASEGTSAQKNLAAQSLYTSTRDFDEQKTQTIKSALGIAPGRSARAQRLYALADESPAAAIKYIESLRSAGEQIEQFGWLAQYLSRSGKANDAGLAEMIQSQNNRMTFQQSIMMYGAQRDPETALQDYLSGPMNQRTQSQLYVVFQQLVQQDPEKALAYLDKIPAGPTRQNLGSVVAAGLAATDPDKALEWARQNDPGGRRNTLVSVVMQIAQSDPQRAFTEAQAIENPQARAQAVNAVVLAAAQTDPAGAAQILAAITDPNARRATVGQLGSSWAQTDFDGAVAWASSLQSVDRRIALTAMGQNLVHSDLDRAIELLDRFPATNSVGLASQIAQNLTQQRSIEEAQAFISQYKGTDDYPRLQVAALTAAASQDPARAMQLAKSVQDERSRDQVYAAIVSQQASRDPELALQWMDAISNPEARNRAMSRIARAWYSQNPSGAQSWVQSLPPGDARDDAIVATTSMHRSASSNTRELIDSIGDSGKRKQALLMHVQRLAQSDPGQAERVLMEIDLSDTEREQYRRMLNERQYIDYGISH